MWSRFFKITLRRGRPGPVIPTTRTFFHPAATKLFFRVQAWKPLQN
jgi:hypothetical protein